MADFHGKTKDLNYSENSSFFVVTKTSFSLTPAWAYTVSMSDPVEEKRTEPEPISEGRAAPTHEEEAHAKEKDEKETEERVQALRVKATELAASLPDDPAVQEALSRLQGDPKTIPAQELEQISRTIREKEAQQSQATLMKGVMTLAGIGAVMSMFGVTNDGRNYPLRLLGTDLPNNIASIPTPERQDGYAITAA